MEARLRRTLTGQANLRYSGKEPVRWMAYLIAHEAHHQGQIALTLKLNGMRLPREVAIRDLWQQWYWAAR